jgi:hypothetical protein
MNDGFVWHGGARIPANVWYSMTSRPPDDRGPQPASAPDSHGSTWWDPTLDGIREAYERGDYDYATAPSIRVLLERIAELEARGGD